MRTLYNIRNSTNKDIHEKFNLLCNRADFESIIYCGGSCLAYQILKDDYNILATFKDLFIYLTRLIFCMINLQWNLN